MPKLCLRTRRALHSARVARAVRALVSARPLRRVGACLFLTSLVLGCGVDDFQPAGPVDPSELYWELALTEQAVTVGLHAPYDTLPLHAVPRSPAGQPLTGLPAPTYVSEDPTKVIVTPEGVLHAVAATAQPVWVTVTLATNNVKHSDSVHIQVVDVADPPVLTTFSMQPVPPDSAKIGAQFQFGVRLPWRAMDNQGQPMNDLLVAFRSSDNLLASIDPVRGEISPAHPGNVTFYASTTAFGVTKVDSVRYRIGAPIFWGQPVLLPQPGTDRSPDFATVIVGVGAFVFWVNQESSLQFSLEFNDADLPNIAPATTFSEWERLSSFLAFVCSASDADCNGTGNTAMARVAARVFTAPGIYDYRCPSCGNVGRVIVVDERE